MALILFFKILFYGRAFKRLGGDFETMLPLFFALFKITACSCKFYFIINTQF
ncbi:hypothetical protein HPCPY1313_0487 [Helicobacter pylori CPY1313]|nr:hypothetical protein HPCPY1313_0487 [Helicobacter pylori CPY1313]